jgi:hypothetical protein
MRAFARYIGIDYSGAHLRVYLAEGEAPSVEVRPQFRCAWQHADSSGIGGRAD